MKNPKTRPRVFGQATEALDVAPQPEASEPSSEFRDELPLLGEETVVVPEAEYYLPITVRITKSLYDDYAKVAAAQDMSVEEVLQHRLAKCKTHNSLRGLWFSDSEHSQLESLLKKRLDTAAQALTLISQAGSVSLDGFQVSLTLPQRKVLNIRTRHGMAPQQIFESMIRKEFQV